MKYYDYVDYNELYRKFFYLWLYIVLSYFELF